MTMQPLRSRIRDWFEQRRIRQVTPFRAHERAACGAAYLDDIDPGWYHRLDADTLELSDGSCCVLGQLHGDFRLGLGRATLFHMGSAPRANLSPVSLGFHAPLDLPPAWQDRDYAYLNTAWQEEIRRRQEAVLPPTKKPPSGTTARMEASKISADMPV